MEGFKFGDFQNLSNHQIKNLAKVSCYVIDKLHTTEVIRYTQGGYTIDTEVKPRCLCITTECVSDNLSSVWFIWLALQL